MDLPPGLERLLETNKLIYALIGAWLLCIVLGSFLPFFGGFGLLVLLALIAAVCYRIRPVREWISNLMSNLRR